MTRTANPENKVDKLVKEGDDDGSGEVTFEEFCILFGIEGACNAQGQEVVSAAPAPAQKPCLLKDRLPTRAEKDANDRLKTVHTNTHNPVHQAVVAVLEMNCATGCDSRGSCAVEMGIYANDANGFELIERSPPPDGSPRHAPYARGRCARVAA